MRGTPSRPILASGYPIGKTGKLRAGVRVKDEAPFGDAILVRVRSLAPHSHLYDKGTAARRTRRGWNRGVMPAQPIFIPDAIAEAHGLQGQGAAHHGLA